MSESARAHHDLSAVVFRTADAAQNPIKHEPQHERDYLGSNNKPDPRG